MHTTVGDIDVELWSKECPKTCENFLQHCLDGFYTDCAFHRVVPGFIVQTGDPEGDGGKSAYGEELKDELHSRLKYTRRGLLGMAKIDGRNGSQFFFTLGPAPELDQNNTLFGKVTGSTVFNMLKLGEGSVVDQVPEYVHRIKKIEILVNPFQGMLPRVLRRPTVEVVVKSEIKAVRDRKLLSFEEESEDYTPIKIKSAHDVGDDPKLLREQVEFEPKQEECLEVLKEEKEESHEEDEYVGFCLSLMFFRRERIRREFQEIFRELKRKEKEVEKSALKRVAFGVDKKVKEDGRLTDEQRKRANEYNIQVKKVDNRKKEKTVKSKKAHERDVLSRLEAFKKRLKTENDLYSHTFRVVHRIAGFE